MLAPGVILLGLTLLRLLVFRRKSLVLLSIPFLALHSPGIRGVPILSLAHLSRTDRSNRCSEGLRIVCPFGTASLLCQENSDNLC